MSLFPKVGRKQPKLRIAWWTIVGFLALGVLLHLIPFYFMITTSFKTGYETLADPPTFWPQQWSLSAWTLAFRIAGLTDPIAAGLVTDGTTTQINPFFLYFWNSIVQAGGAMLLSLPVTALAAYANSKLQRGPMARWSFLFFIGTMMVPAAVTVLPKLLLTLNFPFALPAGSVPKDPDGNPISLVLWDSPWAIILPAGFNAFNFLVFKGFFDTIPNSILQAARVDGGSEFNIFRRIVLPMSVPVFAVCTYFQFSAVWDDFFWASYAFRSPDRIPTSVAIYSIINRITAAGATDASQALGNSQAMKQILATGLTYNGMMVLGLLQTFPIFVMFIICREYLMKGIRIRGLR